MPKELVIAGLRTLIAGGPDRDGGGDGPILCLLHGFGASGDDLFSLWRVLDVPREMRFAFPEAPVSLRHLFGFPAYCWWKIDMERLNAMASGAISGAALQAAMEEMMDEEPPGLPEARRQVMEWLAALRERLGGVATGRVVLGGFSQGAMLATDVALHLGEGVAGLCLLSGALVNRRAWQARLPFALPAPRFQSHGTEDQILPFPLGQALHELLQQGPYPGTFRRFRGGHEIPPGVLDDLGPAITQMIT